MRHVMRKAAFCMAQIRNAKHLAIFCGCTALFSMSDLVENPEDRLSRYAAHMSHIITNMRHVSKTQPY